MCRRSQEGMTLIEILLALLVMVIGIVGILALFPPALQQSKESVEETQAAITAESIAHALTNAVRFAEWDAGNGTYKVTLHHDLQTPSGVSNLATPAHPQKFGFLLPKLSDGWIHYPGTVGHGTNACSYPSDDSNPAFRLAGDPWILSSWQTVRNVNDSSDPYGQFGFSLDVKKINTLQYMVGNSNFTNPSTNQPYTQAEIDPLCKLYEFRVHTFRFRTQAAATSGTGTTTGGAAESKVVIATVVDRVSVK